MEKAKPLEEKLSWKDFIPLVGLWRGMRRKSGLPVTSKILAMTIYHTATFMVPFTYVAYMAKENSIRNNAMENARSVGYENPGEVVRAWKSDLNSDGIDDVTLELRDGSKLEYVAKGYQLKDSK